MLLTHLPDFNLLCQYGTLQTFPKGHVFYDVYDNQSYVYCLTDGLCALTSLKDCGKEHIYNYLKAPAIIGCVPAFINASPANDVANDSYFLLIAKSKCTVYRLTREKFFLALQEYPELVHFVMSTIVDTSRNLLKHSYIANEGTAASKIAATLLALCEPIDGQYTLHKAFNYNELSKYLGIHHITVARVIAYFKESGIITKNGRSIVITDTEELKLYAQNEKTVQY